MGRDKAALRLGGRSLLAHIRRTATRAGWPVRVVRRDIVPCCGPLGGVYSGLKLSQASAVLFLSCDMPFVSPQLLAKVLAALPARELAAFVLHSERHSRDEGTVKERGIHSATTPKRNEFRTPPRDRLSERVGFPFVVRCEALPLVERLLGEKRFALQDLAASLNAKRIRLAKPFEGELFNINTPGDWQRARELWRRFESKE